MSQLLAPSHTVDGDIPLWRRIREIMKEKGSSYSITAMSARIGMSRETLRLLLNGEREIYRFELDKIAQDLKVSLPRLLMEDLKNELNRDMIVHHVARKQFEKAIEYASDRKSVAIGASERAQSYSLSAYIHFWKGELEEAKRYYLLMCPLAEEINEKYQDSSLFIGASINLLNIYVELQNFEKVPELLNQTEHLFLSVPKAMGMWYYAKARWKLSIYEPAEAKECYYHCLDQLKKSSHLDGIVRAGINVAGAEYATRNYAKAEKLLQDALEIADHDQLRILVGKDLAKKQIKLRKFQCAIDLIQQTLQMESIARNPDMKGRLLILFSKSTGDLRYAKAVSSNLNYPMKVRYFAYRYLGAEPQVRKKARLAKGRVPSRRYPLDTYL